MPNYNTLWEARDWLGMPGDARIQGGGGGGQGVWTNRKITRYMGRSRSKPLIPLTEFPGSAHGRGGGCNLFHWNALEQIV